LAFGLPAAGQLLDTTLDDLLDRKVTEQVEQDVAQAVEEVVEQQVESQVVEQIQEQVTGAIEQTLESQVVDAVQEQVESSVVADVAQKVEESVVGEIATKVEESVVGEIATRVEETVVGEIGDQLLDTVEGEIGGIAGGVTDTVRGVVETAGAATEPKRRERFAPDIDPLGRTTEGEVWIILVPNEYADRIAGWGFTIRERQDLATIGRVLLQVAAPEDRDIAQAALDLALDAPGTEVDFNHVYRPSAERGDDGAAAKPAVPAAAAPHGAAPARSVGIVDTAVATDHEALRSADIVQRDFVPFTNERPTAHGTAVASILVGDAGRLHAQFRGGRVYAASVFFKDDKGDDATTAASLTVAGEWLATEGVRVINMSLAGPPNRVLEAAIEALVARGVIVVAAVGNNGPTGEPLYPAAYPNVIGVTAVDAAQHVYRYANRGPQVRFAAPGVDIRVAKSGGGYREMTGTSVAAPHAAAVIANAVAGRAGATPASVLAELERNALDLGAKDFDSVFGFGLIAPLTPVTASR